MKYLCLWLVVLACLLCWCSVAVAEVSGLPPSSQAHVMSPETMARQLTSPGQVAGWSWAKGAELDDEGGACMDLSGSKIEYVKFVLLALAWGALMIANGYLLSLATPSPADFVVGGGGALVGTLVAIYAGARLRQSQNRSLTITVLVLSLALVAISAATLIKTGVQRSLASKAQPLAASMTAQPVGLRIPF